MKKGRKLNKKEIGQLYELEMKHPGDLSVREQKDLLRLQERRIKNG